VDQRLTKAGPESSLWDFGFIVLIKA
jgi:hypothetical protein